MLECYTCSATEVISDDHDEIQAKVSEFDEVILDDFVRRLGLLHCVGKPEQFRNDCPVTCKTCFNQFANRHNIEGVE